MLLSRWVFTIMQMARTSGRSIPSIVNTLSTVLDNDDEHIIRIYFAERGYYMGEQYVQYNESAEAELQLQHWWAQQDADLSWQGDWV